VGVGGRKRHTPLYCHVNGVTLYMICRYKYFAHILTIQVNVLPSFLFNIFKYDRINYVHISTVELNRYK